MPGCCHLTGCLRRVGGGGGGGGGAKSLLRQHVSLYQNGLKNKELIGIVLLHGCLFTCRSKKFLGKILAKKSKILAGG